MVENCYNNGQYTIAGFRKIPAVASAPGIWSDITMAPGSPKPNYYTGTELAATVFDPRSTLYHGEAVSPFGKYLHKISLSALASVVQAGTYMLCDFLMYYPLIDMDSTDEQTFTNPISLPRYASGDGVRAFLVATNPYVGSGSFVINYTDFNGNSGVTSNLHLCNTSTNIGTIVNSTTTALNTVGPFIQGPGNKQGIRSVQSIQFYAPNGGLGALALCKPLATFTINEIAATTEIDFLSLHPSLPKIEDGAVLGLLCCPGGSIAACWYTGVLTTIFN